MPPKPAPYASFSLRSKSLAARTIANRVTGWLSGNGLAVSILRMGYFSCCITADAEV